MNPPHPPPFLFAELQYPESEPESASVQPRAPLSYMQLDQDPIYGPTATYLDYQSSSILESSSSQPFPYVDHPQFESHSSCHCPDCRPHQIINQPISPLFSPTPQHYYAVPPFPNLSEQVPYFTQSEYPIPAPPFSSSLANALQIQHSPHPHQPIPLHAPYDPPTTPLMTFPTPSELYIDLVGTRAPDSTITPVRRANHSKSGATDPAHAQAHTQAPDRAKKAQSRRKERQQHIAEAIGFRPTDPDSISSHDKRRHYMDCLEQYVLYLHNQLRLVGQEPIPVQRMATYRGLNSRSIRTMLVYMEDTARKLNVQVMEGEQLYHDLHKRGLHSMNEEYQQSAQQ